MEGRSMKKENMIAALLCSACLVAGSVNPVFADASKVVTLGADLRMPEADNNDEIF